MNGVVFRNPRAGSAAQAIDLAALSPFPVVDLTEEADIPALAKEAIARGARVVVAAGGDGTVSSIAGALVGTEATLGVVPLGTGNDLARSLDIPLDAAAAMKIITSGRDRAIDVVRAEPDDGDATYVINVAAGGLSGQVDEEMDAAQKQRWGPFAYLWTAVKVLPDVKPYSVELTLDGRASVIVDAVNVVVANGRTVAGGWAVAPNAELDDGFADVIVVRYANALDLAAVAARLAAGNYLDSPSVEHHAVRSVRVRCASGMPFNVDGELVTRAGCTFSVVPKSLRVRVAA